MTESPDAARTTTTTVVVVGTPVDAYDPDLTDQDVADLLARLGRHWGLFLSFGLLSVVLGVVIMVWPQITVLAIAVLLGAWLVVSGVFALVSSIASSSRDTSARVMQAIVGALSLLLGILAFRSADQAVEILALFVGIAWLIRGTVELLVGIQAKGQPGRGLTITLGALGLVAGAVVLLWPGITLTALAWVTGLWLVLLGIIWLVAALKLRGNAPTLTPQESTPPAR